MENPFAAFVIPAATQDQKPVVVNGPVIGRSNVIRLTVPVVRPFNIGAKFNIFRNPNVSNLFISKTDSYFGAKFGANAVDLKLPDTMLLTKELTTTLSLSVASLIGGVISASGSSVEGFNLAHFNERYGVLTTSLQSSTHNISKMTIFSDLTSVFEKSSLPERVAPVLSHYGYRKNETTGEWKREMIETPAKVIKVENRKASLSDFFPYDAVIIHSSWDSKGKVSLPIDLVIGETRLTDLQNNTNLSAVEIMQQIPHIVSVMATYSQRRAPYIFLILPKDENFEMQNYTPYAAYRNVYSKMQVVKYRAFSVLIFVPTDSIEGVKVNVDAVNAAIARHIETGQYVDISTAVRPPESQLFKERVDGFSGSDSEHLAAIRERMRSLLTQAGVPSERIAKILANEHSKIWSAAFTHVSYAIVNIKDMDIVESTYERLEYLGDGVTKSIFKDRLFSEYPHLSERPLTEISNRYLNKSYMSKFSRHMGLSRLIRTEDAKITLSMEEDSYESTFGALFTVVKKIASKGAAYEICEKLFELTLKEFPIELGEWGKIPDFTALDQRLQRLDFGKKGKFFDIRVDTAESESLKANASNMVYGIYAKNSEVESNFLKHNIISVPDSALAKARGASPKAVREQLAGIILKKLDEVGLTEKNSYDVSLARTFIQRGYTDITPVKIQEKISMLNRIFGGGVEYSIVIIRTIRSMELADAVTVSLNIETIDLIQNQVKHIFICTYPKADKNVAERILYERFIELDATNQTFPIKIEVGK